ncbi:MAG: hypothetical protein WC867_02565 [Candidatus Pacearchaeota archaeon]|jgi:hypothetical protein
MVKAKIIEKNLKFLFIILNLIISIFAFSSLVYAQNTPSPPNVSASPPIPPTVDLTGTPLTPGSQVMGGSNIPVSPPPGFINSPPPTTGNNKPPTPESPPGNTGNGITGFFNENILQKVMTAITLGSFIGGTAGSLAGGKNGVMWGSISGTVGVLTYQILAPHLGNFKSLLIGLGVGALIFILTYQKESEEIVEFSCLAWEAPIGGEDCQKCNLYEECSEYTCKSLGQACEIVNEGTKEQKCIWKNPHDVNSPIITIRNLSKDLIYKPNLAVRPPATGIKITTKSGNCIKAFTPLEFSFDTDEPSQCKIDYNLTKSSGENLTNGYDDMMFYVGGETLYVYNHTEKLSLPGPDALNKISPTLKNDGDYNLYIRCRDANGNFNNDAFSVSFCVEKGPDVTPPIIESVNIPSESPVQFNRSNIQLEIYVNEPSECKWSREDRTFVNMENKMKCDTNVWDMNSKNVYTCRTTLTGIISRKDNDYYFRCKDQPWAEEKDRNVNIQSYLYKVVGTQPLNIMSVGPNGTISGATDFIPVFLEIDTDNGYNNGEAICYFSNKKPTKDEEYVQFLETGNNHHNQRQDLPTGEYKYYFKCVDLGGNTAYNTTQFKVLSDKNPPEVIRVYKEEGGLKIITDKESQCTYSNLDCNFEIESGIKMYSMDKKNHISDWINNQNYFIRCKDNFGNQPNPNFCTIAIKPSKIDKKEESILL